MSISLRVDGRPGPCRRTARQLTRTGQAVADAADFLLRERLRSVDGLDGGAGVAYRERVTTSADDAEMLSRCVAKLGRGLVELADAIQDVGDQMERVRDLVAPYDLVQGDRLQQPVDRSGDDPHLVQARRLAYRDAVDRVRRARKDEREAQDDWRSTLASYAIDLGQDTVPGIPAGLFLPPVEDAPTPTPTPSDRPSDRPLDRPLDLPRVPERPDTPRPDVRPTGPGHEAAAEARHPSPGSPGSDAAPAREPRHWTLAGVALGGTPLGGHVLGGHVLGEGRPVAQLAQTHPLDPSLTDPDPQGSEPGGPPHLEASHVTCPADSRLNS